VDGSRRIRGPADAEHRDHLVRLVCGRALELSLRVPRLRATMLAPCWDHGGTPLMASMPKRGRA
jgi:hypothetical protein